MKQITLFVLFLFPFLVKGFTYTSVVSGGNWQTASTWTSSNGGTEYPGFGGSTTDNAIINTNVSTSTTTVVVNNVTINSGYTLTTGTGQFQIYGELINNGTFSTVGHVFFWGTGIVISNGGGSAGTFTQSSTASGFWFGNTPQTIDAGVNLTLNAENPLEVAVSYAHEYFGVPANEGITLTNNGTITILCYNGLLNFGGSSSCPSTFINNGSITATQILSSFDVLNATASGNTVTWSSSSSVTLRTTLSNTYYNLVITSSGGNGTLSLPASTIVSNNLTIQAGVLDVTTNNYGLTVGGNWSNSDGTGAFTARNGTVTFDGTSNQSIGGSSSTTFYNLTINPSAGVTVSLGASETVSHNLTISTGTLNSAQYQLTGNATGTFSMASGTSLLLGSTTSTTNTLFPTNFTNGHISLLSSSTVTYQANGSQTVSATPTYDNLTISTGASASTKTPSGTPLTIAGNLTINSNATLSETTNTVNLTGNLSNSGTLSFSSGICNITGSITTNSGTVSFTTGTLNLTGNLTNTGTVSFTTGPFNIDGNFSNSGTYTAGTGTVSFKGTTGQTINGSSTTSFYNLTATGNSGETVTLGHAENVTNNFILSAGTFDVSASNYGLTVGGNFTNDGTFTAHNGIVTMNTSGSATLGGTSSTSFYQFTESGTGTVTLGNNEITTNNFQISSGTFDASASNYNLTVGGNFTNKGTFTARNGTVTMNTSGSATLGGTASTSFYNLTESGTGTVTLGISETATNNLQISSGIFDVSASNYALNAGSFSNSGTFNAEAGTLTVNGSGGNGNFTNNGTFTAGTGTLSMSGSGGQSIGGSTAVSFYNLTIAGTGGETVTLNTSEIFTNLITMTSGILAASGSNTMTLVSTSTAATASVGPIAAGASITANFIVERYLPRNTAAFMGLSSPVYSPAETGTTTVSGKTWTYYYGSLADWNINNRTSTDATFYMSGVKGPDGSAGSYVSVYNFTPPSTYTAISANFSSPSAANDYVIPQGGAVYLWIGYSLSKMAPYSYITHGVPVQGTIAAGSGFVGNPYPSSINWATFSAHNGLASYQVYTSGGSWTSSTSNIAMGQGIEVSSAVSFLETDKIASAATLDAPEEVTPLSGENIVTFTLYNDANEYWTPAIVSFGKNYSTSYNQKEDDALFLSSILPDVPPLYTVSEDNKNLELNRLPDSAQVMDVPLTAIGVVSANYTLTATGLERLSSYNCVTLIDKSSGRILANFEDSPDYTFTVSNPGEIKNYILRFTKLAPGETCASPDNVSFINVLPGEISVIPDQAGATVKFNLQQQGNAIISVYNMVGQKISADINTYAYDNSIQVNLPSGQVYIIKVQTASGLVIKKLYH
ncbi:MAG: hypothetical protein ACLQQ4_16530 [Bacteroidia bacterium]